MRSVKRGKYISKAEITNISEHGFWVCIDSTEYFLPFDKFPWFKNATINQIADVQLYHGTHLHWPQLDADLSTKIIANPEKYKLVDRHGIVKSPNAKER